MEDSRGQIILVAALAIAVTFVALALIVNTVIFTENLATRETVSGTEAVTFQQNVADSGEELMVRAQRYNDTDYGEMTDAFRRDIGVLSESENLHAVTGGSIREISVVSIRNGTKINQSTIQDFNDTQDNETWEMANGVTATRDFVMNFDSFDGDDFRVNVSGSGSDWWAMQVNSSQVTLYNGSGEIGACPIAAPWRVGITNGSINGTDCAALQFAEGVTTPYKITIENGSQAEGTYTLIVNEERGDIEGTLPDNNYGGAASEPTLTRVFYNTTLGVHFERDDLTYRSNVTLAPAW